MLLTITAFYTDHRKMIIPNRLTFGGIIIGLAWHGVSSGWAGLQYALLGMLASMGFMLLIYLCRGVEAGDVKFFAALGAIGGFEIGAAGMFYSLIIAGAAGIILLLHRRLRTGRGKGSGHERVQFPFMYAVLPGMICSFIMLEVPL
ncbi:A24 family peptidase [Insulibacter thermoxylanivorax]|nr:prepilin peptidase [Insulibacter thermoxylanivorax]